MRLYKDAKSCRLNGKDRSCLHIVNHQLEENKRDQRKNLEKLIESWMGLLHLQNEDPNLLKVAPKHKKEKKTEGNKRRLRKKESWELRLNFEKFLNYVSVIISGLNWNNANSSLLWIVQQRK